MRIETRSFPGDASTFEISAPKGAQVVDMRMNRLGQYLVVLKCDDEATEEEPIEVMVLMEDQGNVGDGAASDWDHAGQWTFSNGRVAHGFRRVAKQARRRRINPVAVDRTESE